MTVFPSNIQYLEFGECCKTALGRGEATTSLLPVKIGGKEVWIGRKKNTKREREWKEFHPSGNDLMDCILQGKGCRNPESAFEL